MEPEQQVQTNEDQCREQRLPSAVAEFRTNLSTHIVDLQDFSALVDGLHRRFYIAAQLL